MPYPPIYDIAYNYTGFQYSQQGISAFPGTQIDADFAGLKDSIAGVSAFMQYVIRSDGALKNGIVTYDSLSANPIVCFSVTVTVPVKRGHSGDRTSNMNRRGCERSNAGCPTLNPNDSDRFSADHFASEGTRAFALAGLSHDVIYNTVIGLRCVLQLSNHDGVVDLSERSVKLLVDASRSAVATIAEQVEETLSAERACVGMGAAIGLIALFGKRPEHVTAATTFPMVMDRIDHVALLAAELDILSRRRSIEMRGDVLRRAVQARQFLDLELTDDIQLN